MTKIGTLGNQNRDQKSQSMKFDGQEHLPNVQHRTSPYKFVDHIKRKGIVLHQILKIGTLKKINRDPKSETGPYRDLVLKTGTLFPTVHWIIL